MRIHAISRDIGGCMFYRIRVPLGALGDAGHETSWGVGIDFDSAGLDRDSVIVGQLLNGPEDLEFWRWLAAIPDRPLMVYEVDDDLFAMDTVITKEMRNGKPLLWEEAATQHRVKEFMRLADLVTVSTPHLAALYRPHARRIAVLPNAVPDWVFDEPIREPGLCVFGWTLSDSHLLDARSFAYTLIPFMDAHKGAVMHWIGPHGIPDSPLDKWREKVTPWVGDVNQYLQQLPGMMSVGLAPLNPGRFNAGKSGLKAQEYAAIGVPSVVADVDQYRAVVRHGVTGYLAGPPHDWQQHMRTLYRDKKLRRSMGAKARDLEATRRASQVCHHWTDAYQGALNDRTGR